MVDRHDTAEYVTQLKKAFIDTKLTPLLKAMESSLEDITYKPEINKGIILKETVIVTFKGGGTRYIDITADSLKAAVMDVIRFF